MTVSLANTAELLEMLFELCTLVGPMVVHSGATWRIQLNRPCAVAMRPLSKITLTTGHYNVCFSSCMPCKSGCKQFPFFCLLSLPQEYTSRGLKGVFHCAENCD